MSCAYLDVDDANLREVSRGYLDSALAAAYPGLRDCAHINKGAISRGRASPCTLVDHTDSPAWSSNRFDRFTMAKHLTVTTNYARYVLVVLLCVYGERER